MYYFLWYTFNYNIYNALLPLFITAYGQLTSSISLETIHVEMHTDIKHHYIIHVLSANLSIEIEHPFEISRNNNISLYSFHIGICLTPNIYLSRWIFRNITQCLIWWRCREFILIHCNFILQLKNNFSVKKEKMSFNALNIMYL